MAHLYTEPAPPLRLYHVAYTLLAFGLLVAGAVFYALTQPDPSYFRANAYAWGAAVLVIPALYLMTRRLCRRPLNHWWRLLWTFGLILMLAHNVAMLGWSHLWRPDLLMVQFGVVGALVLWGLEIVWIVDVLLAWNRFDWARAENAYGWWQCFVSTLVFLAFAAVLLIVGTATISTVLGAALVVAVALGWLLRFYDREEA